MTLPVVNNDAQEPLGLLLYGLGGLRASHARAP